MTILAVLTILLGVLIVIAGVLLLIASAVLVSVIPSVFGLGVTVIGGIVFVFGLIWIAVGAGLLNLRSWAWWLAIIVMILSLVGSITAPAAAIVPGLILVYLILVRHHFR